MRTRCDCFQTGSSADLRKEKVSGWTRWGAARVPARMVICGVSVGMMSHVMFVFPSSCSSEIPCVPTRHYVSSSSLPPLSALTQRSPLALSSVCSGHNGLFIGYKILKTERADWSLNFQQESTVMLAALWGCTVGCVHITSLHLYSRTAERRRLPCKPLTRTSESQVMTKTRQVGNAREQGRDRISAMVQKDLEY